jgi:hypothetical protein
MIGGVGMIAALLAPAAAAAPPDGWTLGPAAQITYGEAGKLLYRLDCTGPDLVVTQFGVTELLDLEANKPVADTEGTALPRGAALMSLATDRTDEPKLVPAVAVRNPVKGWDMTIRLAKGDPVLRSLPRAKYISLFTTGFTRMSEPSRADRERLATFVGQCRGQNPG